VKSIVLELAGVLVHGSVTNISIGLSPQIAVDKVMRLQDENPFELGKVQEMFIPTDDTCCSSCKGTLEEFIIRGVMLYHWRKAGREHNLRMNGQKIDERPRIDLGKSRGELKHDPILFLQDCRRDKNLNLAITPSLENLIRRPPEEKTGNEHIRVQDYLHLRPRTFASAASTSAFFKPVLRACRRAWRIRSSKLSMEGAERAFRITTSRSPTTTN
jgi:hypothetical protein